MSKDRLLTIEEAAQYLNVSKTSLRRWTKIDRLPCARVGVRQERRFHQSDLDRFLSRSANSGESRSLSGAGLPDMIAGEAVASAGAVARSAARHVALYFHDRDELWKLFRPYVADHLQVGAPILYVHDERARYDVLMRFRAEGWDPDHLIEEGMLKLLAPAEAYLRNGTFVPERMLDFMEAAILYWRASSYSQILIAGEMTWYLSGAPGVESMIEYEHQLNDLLVRYPNVTIVCHYDTCRLNGTTVLGALCSHPYVQLPDRLVPGFFQASHPK
ncbi:MAG: MEDS domain-containing protein [Burkholderiales bacterium]|nr:MEDS domain-containing protein [Burkholderiales bacterium]